MSDKPLPDDQFRAVLEDVVAVCERLSAACHTTAELVGVCRLALENDGQLKLLFRTVKESGKR